MSASTDIETYLVSAIPGAQSSLALTGAAYTGQKRKNLAKNQSARVRYLRQVDLARDQGRVRHHVEIELRRWGIDKAQEDTKGAAVRLAAEQLENSFDGAVVAFQAGLPDLRIERVRCYREEPIEVEVRGVTRIQKLRLEIDAWEA